MCIRDRYYIFFTLFYVSRDLTTTSSFWRLTSMKSVLFFYTIVFQGPSVRNLAFSSRVGSTQTALRKHIWLFTISSFVICYCSVLAMSWKQSSCTALIPLLTSTFTVRIWARTDSGAVSYTHLDVYKRQILNYAH